MVGRCIHDAFLYWCGLMNRKVAAAMGESIPILAFELEIATVVMVYCASHNTPYAELPLPRRAQ